MTFGGGAIATIMGGIAAEATGGDFAEGALTAMVVFLYNDVWADRIASRVAFGNNKDKSNGAIWKGFKKGAKDLKDGAVSLPKGLIKYGDFLARSTGFRDWQNGNRIPWNKLEAQVEYKVFLYAMKYHKTDIIKALGRDMMNRPNYYLGGAAVGAVGGYIFKPFGSFSAASTLTVKPAAAASDYIHTHINPLH